MMAKNGLDAEIAKVDAEIVVLQAVRARLVQAQTPDGDEVPKVKRGRKKKGLPSAVPPASEANQVGRL